MVESGGQDTPNDLLRRPLQLRFKISFSELIKTLVIALFSCRSCEVVSIFFCRYSDPGHTPS